MPGHQAPEDSHILAEASRRYGRGGRRSDERRAYDGARLEHRRNDKGTASRGPLSPHAAEGMLLGPYETSYDVRRGYGVERTIVRPANLPY